VRQLIWDPSAPLSTVRFAAQLNGYYDAPWIGVGKLNGELTLLAAVGDHMIFFPPADSTDFYVNKLPKDLTGLSMDRATPDQKSPEPTSTK
jgi:hypothetical protein